MGNITYQATLREIAHLIETKDYSNPELTQDLLQNGVTEPIILMTNGTKSRFGMKKIVVKDGAKRLNLAAKNLEIGQLKAQVTLISDSVDDFAEMSQVKQSTDQEDAKIYHDVYSWKNEKRNISERCTAGELAKKYGIRVQYLYTVIKGKLKSTRGWSLT